MRRLGMLGFGSIAENGHLPALQSFPGMQVVAVADVSPERLARARELLPGAALYDSPHKLIADADVTGVDICTPPNTHADLIVAACERGLGDVICEKPLVLTEDEYRRVARARAASGSRVVSVNNWMHSDLNRHVSAVLEADTIGSILSIELQTGRPAAALGNGGWMPRWRTDLAHSGGGIILDHGWHQFYLLLGWMREPIQTVSATARTVDPRHAPVEDEAEVEMQFASGTGRVELSWTSKERTNRGFIQGSDGSIAIHDDRIEVQSGVKTRELPFAGRLTQSSYHPDWFQAMFRRNLLDEDRTEADRNFAEAGALVSAIQAAYDSAKAGGTPRTPLVQ
ncbi:MAG TPA: Gfo/Idh/MocA family oxidoreductase [Chloroflexota bacterium]